jgi:hypothetical protein
MTTGAVTTGPWAGFLPRLTVFLLFSKDAREAGRKRNRYGQGR